jgi:hypothetical protein
MKTAPHKVTDNAVKAVLAVLDGLCIIHEHGGFGAIELKVKDDMVTVVRPSVQWNVASKDDLTN